MKHKVNPRRQPVSMADLKRAKQEATSEAVEKAWALMFTALHDKEGWGVVRMQRLWKEINDLSDSVARGYCTIPDLKNVLKIETGAVLK